MASAQALVLFGGAAVPVTNTGSAVWISNYFKLCEPNLTIRDVKAMQAYSLLKYYAAANDYTNNHGGLIRDATAFMRGISNLNFDVAVALNDWNASDTSNSAIGLDIAAILANAKDFRQLSEETLNKIVVYLRSQLQV